MKNLILAFAFLFPFVLFSQVDLSVDSVFQRMGHWGQFSNGLDFYEAPINRLDTIVFSAHVSNLGADSVTNVQLDVAVYKDGLLSDIVSSSPQNLCAGCTDSLFTTNLIINQTGDYKFLYLIDSDSLDIDSTNNQDSLELLVYNSGAHRRDNGSEVFYSDSVPGITGNSMPQAVGNIYEAYTDVEFNKVRLQLSNDQNQITNLIYISIYTKSPTDTAWQWKTQSSDYTLTAGDCNGGEVLIYLEGACIDQGDLYAVMLGNYATGWGGQVAYNQEVEYGTVLYQSYSGGNWELEFMPNPRAVSVYPYYGGTYNDCTLGLDSELNVKLRFQLHPNPSNSQTTIQYELKQNAHTEILLTELSGRLIRTSNPGNQIAGTHQELLEISELPAGIYFVTLKAGDHQKTKKLIISK